MHYFRYRPYSEFSLKELLYGEMYFSSPEECNDPFDSKTYYSFNSDHQKWSKLILLASERIGLKVSEKDLSKLANFACKLCPISYEDALNKNLFSECTDVLFNGKLVRDYLYSSLQEILKVYQPAKRYFVSFSRTNSETLMWSHYSNQHNGYCLIFKAIDGKLNQSPIFKKQQIRRVTPNGLAKEMSYNMSDSFNFIDIEYKSKIDLMDAFLFMPVAVTGDAENDEERASIREKQGIYYQQKGNGWQYENESRLILSPPPPWLFGGQIEYSKQERLFHYEPSQLVGIIYGARMSEQNKNRIREVLNHRKEWLEKTIDYQRIVFNFIEFEARMSTNNRGVDIVPISILGVNRILPTDEDFGRYYSEWKEGVGWERSAKGSKRVLVK